MTLLYRGCERWTKELSFCDGRQIRNAKHRDDHDVSSLMQLSHKLRSKVLNGVAMMLGGRDVSRRLGEHWTDRGYAKGLLT